MANAAALRASTPAHPASISILKSSSDLIIAGYASVEMVDKQGDLITRGALKDAFGNFMKAQSFRNVQLAHSNIQVGEVIKSYTDSDGRLWKSGVDDAGMFVVIQLRDDIEKAREVANEIRKGNLTGFSIGGQAFKRINKADAKHGDYTEISKLELHEVTICEKGINPEASFRILKEDTTMTNEIDALGELSSVIDRLSKQLDDMDKEEDLEKKVPFMDDEEGEEGEEDEEEELEELLEGGKPKHKKQPMDAPMGDQLDLAEDDDMADKKEKKDEKDDDEKKMYKDDTKKSEYSDVITSEYLDWMENTLKSAGVDTGAARSHFDGVSKANLGSTPEQFPETQMNGQVAGRATEGGSPGTNALGASGLGSGSVAKSYLNPETVTATEIEEAYAVFKAAATEQQFKNNLNDVFSERLTKELTSEAQNRAAAEFDARGPLSSIEKAISQLSDRIDNISSSTSAEIRKSTNHSTVDIPSTEELANMSWDEVHSLAGTVWN
ncbi:HK97 family phage prohead protease [bacterium]|nr:HK97 family phage prohead protease [bacterium]